jgi:hypothetical protein
MIDGFCEGLTPGFGTRFFSTNPFGLFASVCRDEQKNIERGISTVARTGAWPQIGAKRHESLLESSYSSR